MTSGEWDLRALKALEEEEQAEFRSISESNLLQPPPPPSLGLIRQSSPGIGVDGGRFLSIHSHPHSHLLLPTINEFNNSRKDIKLAGGNGGENLKTTAKKTGGFPFQSSLNSSISLSDVSLPSPYLSYPGSSRGKKPIEVRTTKLRTKGTLSPPQRNSSPIYTPPAIRRCATLSHSTPVRKHFKSLHQECLEKKQQQQQQSEDTIKERSDKAAIAVKKIKRYWSYSGTSRSLGGSERHCSKVDSFASSSIGSGWSSSDNTEEIEEEQTVEEAKGKYQKTQQILCEDHSLDDGEETETGSCTVPLKTDSIEMMRLMLFSATSAVTTTPTRAVVGNLQLGKLPPPDVATGSGMRTFNENITVLDGGRKFLPFSRYPIKKYHSCDESGKDDGSGSPIALSNDDDNDKSNPSRMCIINSKRRESFSATGNDGFYVPIKIPMEKPAVYGANENQLDSENELETITADEPPFSPGTGLDTVKPQIGHSIDVDTIKVNHLNNLTKSTQMVRSTKLRMSARTILKPSPTTSRNMHNHQIQQEHTRDQQPNQGAATLCVEGMNLINDDELEHHIKHCSCSCNHMGYGNSMDYQTTGFGGLPDVTEHSNIRRTLSQQNSISNSDSGAEVSSMQKAKSSFGSNSNFGKLADGGRRQLASCKNLRSENEKSKKSVCIFGLTLMAAVCLAIIAAALAYQHYFMSPSRNSHEQRLRIVRRILKDVPLVDGHNNFAWNVRKYAHNSLELIHLSNDLEHNSVWTRPSWAQTDIERLKIGLMGVQVWSANVPCKAQGLDAVQLALEQVDIIHRFADMNAKDTTLVTSYQDILNARRKGLMASLIGIEGGHAIESSLGVLRSFYALGARYLSLTHKCDIMWASSSSSTRIENNGLSQFGKSVIKEMNRLGMMIDLSHSSDATARDVLQVTRAPVIFSHSAARQLCNSTHNIPDDILRLVADNGGLIMISFDSDDVTCGRPAHLLDVIAHIKYIRSIAGIQHIGIGAGYDAIEQPPTGLEDVSKYPDLLATLLEDSNWSEEDIAMLAGRNFLRVLKSVENVRDYWKRAAIQPVESTTEHLPKSHCTYMSS